jgi:hypothetical protein
MLGKILSYRKFFLKSGSKFTFASRFAKATFYKVVCAEPPRETYLSLVDTVNVGFRQKRGMAGIISMTTRGSLEKHLRIGTPNGSMGQRRLQKFFSFLCITR